MGHIRLGRLPATKRWQQVVALLSEGASVEQIAGASAEAAQSSLKHARDDTAVLQSFWLLTQIPLAARSPDFPHSLQRLGLGIGVSPSLFDVLGAFAAAVDRQSEKSVDVQIWARWPSMRLPKALQPSLAANSPPCSAQRQTMSAWPSASSQRLTASLD